MRQLFNSSLNENLSRRISLKECISTCYIDCIAPLHNNGYVITIQTTFDLGCEPNMFDTKSNYFGEERVSSELSVFPASNYPTVIPSSSSILQKSVHDFGQDLKNANREIVFKSAAAIGKTDDWKKSDINIPNQRDDDGDVISGYKKRWGIPIVCKLMGGGENALNVVVNAGASAGGGGGWVIPSNNNAAITSGTPPAANTTASLVAAMPTNAGSASANWTTAANSANRQQTPTAAPIATPNNNNNATTTNTQQSSNNASHQSNSPQNTAKTSGNQNLATSPPGSSTNQQQQQQQQSPGNNAASATSWAQAACKNLPTPSSSQNTSPTHSNSVTSSSGIVNGGNPTANNDSSAASTNGTESTTDSNGNLSNGSGTPTNTSTSKQLEQLATMREALFSMDGWGGQHVNQDSTWDIPPSPEPIPIKDSNGVLQIPWKPNVNNGTDLWEANLRNGGQPPPQVVQKAPWGHTPSTNIGGTWGEDDEGSDSSSVWNSSTNNPGGNNGGVGGNPAQQWGSGPNTNQSQPMWGNSKKDDWSNGGQTNNNNNWNDPRDMNRAAVNGIDPRNSVDMTPHMRGVIDHGHRMGGGDGILRGDPRGITGRLNGAAVAEQLWGGPPPNQPGGPGAHHVNPTGPPPGPPAPGVGGNKVSGWKDLPGVNPNIGRMQLPPGGSALPQNRMNAGAANMNNAASGLKPDQPLWPHPNRNGSWGDNGPHDMNSAPWEDKMPPWNEPLQSWALQQKPKTPMTPGGWASEPDMDPSSWSHPAKIGPKALTKEIVWASKQFRILSEMNFKKEDVENALRTSNMVLEDALEYLNATRCNVVAGGVGSGNVVDGWRRHDTDPSPFDHSANQPYQQHRFNAQQQQQQLPFAIPPSGGNANNNGGNISPSLNPAVVQKMLAQQPPLPPPSPQQQQLPPQQQQQFPNINPRPSQNNTPSAHQLHSLVQQIHMAVTAGYLNHQILNQPLAPQTLILLNQLLQHIKLIQQLKHQQQLLGPTKNNGALMSVTTQLTKAKHQIQTLQNQIGAQQALYLKQQQHQQQHQQQQQQQQQQHHMNQSQHQPQQQSMNDYFSKPDPLSILQSNFTDMAIKDSQMVGSFQNQQSRLNQWKLPSLDKDDLNMGNEFSRAPGSTAKPPGSPNLNPLLGQGDSTWSTVPGRCETTGWPEQIHDMQDNKDWAQNSGSNANFTDLVPEFEPGKPWKGNQLKNIEDDPSITPGSVVRSPLSLAAIKDSDLFAPSSAVGGGAGGGKTSPNSMVDMALNNSLASSTWSFNASSTSSMSFTSPLGKLNNNVGGSKGGSWSDDLSGSGDLWPLPKSRGPPPGLSGGPVNKTGSSNQLSGVGGPGGPIAGGNNSNGWVGGNLASPRWQSNPPNPWGGAAASPWLLLKNLTPQIDGSTLKTLCIQHGPVQSFHLFLNHGIALAKYCTREEACKAQGALNNCLLGNTTIFAESPAEGDVQALLQTLNSQNAPGGGGNNWNPNNVAAQNKRMQQQQGGVVTPNVAPTDTWGNVAGSSQLWPSALWGAPPSGLDNPDPHRSTPSSLNSFLPGDLLGGESM